MIGIDLKLHFNFIRSNNGLLCACYLYIVKI